jgi:hypothetical protein
MSDRDEILAYLGLPAGATFSEIEQAYIRRCNSASERLAAGDESARVELAVLKEVYGRLVGRSLDRQEKSSSVRSAGTSTAMPEEQHSRAPAWWECYLALLFSLASVAALVVLIAYLPHVYRKGGFLIPLGLIASGALLSILGSMLAETEYRQGRRAYMLERKGLDTGRESVHLRFNVARIAALLSRTVRWLIVPALIVTMFFNFASLSGRWSLRH